MSILPAYLLLVASAVLVVPAVVLLGEVLFALIRRPHGEPAHCDIRPRVAVLVPAHNEASHIVATVRAIAPQLAARDRLIVIADNCVDQTALLAGREGCEVVVRVDKLHRGKGYALDAGIRFLESRPPDIVICIDADSRIMSGFVERLARRCTSLGRPVQARYMMLPPANASLKTRIAAFAWAVKNYLRPGGLYRLGLPCQLMGSGMAFPWRCIRTAALGTGHIVEDLKLGIELALAGYPAAFCPDVVVTSTFPVSKEGQRTQRARWEHGHLGVILSDAPHLLWQSLRRRNVGLLALALDLCVPPLALLVLMTMTLCAVNAGLAVIIHSLIPLGLSLLSLALLATAVMISWSHEGRRLVSFRDLGYAFIYAFSKLPLYARFLFARQTRWVRSTRDNEDIGTIASPREHIGQSDIPLPVHAVGASRQRIRGY